MVLLWLILVKLWVNKWKQGKVDLPICQVVLRSYLHPMTNVQKHNSQSAFLYVKNCLFLFMLLVQTGLNTLSLKGQHSRVWAYFGLKPYLNKKPSVTNSTTHNILFFIIIIILKNTDKPHSKSSVSSTKSKALGSCAPFSHSFPQNRNSVCEPRQYQVHLYLGPYWS